MHLGNSSPGISGSKAMNGVYPFRACRWISASRCGIAQVGSYQRSRFRVSPPHSNALFTPPERTQRRVAVQHGHAADGALRPRDRCFLKVRIGPTALPIYRCAAADAHAVGWRSNPPLSDAEIFDIAAATTARCFFSKLLDT